MMWRSVKCKIFDKCLTIKDLEGKVCLGFAKIVKRFRGIRQQIGAIVYPRFVKHFPKLASVLTLIIKCQ